MRTQLAGLAAHPTWPGVGILWRVIETKLCVCVCAGATDQNVRIELDALAPQHKSFAVDRQRQQAPGQQRWVESHVCREEGKARTCVHEYVCVCGWVYCGVVVREGVVVSQS